MPKQSSFIFYFLWLFLSCISLNASAAGMMRKDTTPDAFAFIDQTNAVANATVTSNSITVSGINSNASISVTGGKFSINGGAFRTSSTSVSNGNTVRVQQTTANSPNTTINTSLNIGGVSDTFSVTTATGENLDTTPNAFSFTPQTNLAVSSVVTSNTITVSGINAATAISVSGGLYSINGGAFVTTPRTVSNGNIVAVRVTTAATAGTTSNVTLTVGGVSATFSATTVVATGGFLLPPQSAGDSQFISEHFQGSTTCAQCHDGLRNNKGEDVAIQKDWSATMMANAARDPLWKAKVRSELNRNPQLTDTISDKCTRCHAPMANFEAKSKNEPKSILAADSGFLNANHSRHDEAMNGVSCTLCHQIPDSPKLGTLESFTGQYEINANKLIYGQYENPFTMPMQMHTVGYVPTFGAHIESSKLCGTCHNLKTPYVDENGTVKSTTPESEFPEQMPYSEWEHSSHAQPATMKTCQNCHMPYSDGVRISTMPGANSPMISARNNFGKHDFVGANKLMLDIFNNNKAQLGVLAATADFDETIDKTQTMLNSSATISSVNQNLSGSDLNITLRINSATGHKLPSAYPSRRVVLHVTVKDAANIIVFESGKVNANGSIVGVDADLNPATFEPHYDVIDSADKVQVYEAIMGDTNNNVTYTLLRGAAYLKDNRILPTGFNKATASNDIKVVGDALTDTNFVGGSDEITYRVAGLTGNNYTVEAELVHQPVAYSFAQDLFSDSTNNEAADFKTMFDASNSKTSRIALNTFSVSR